MTLDELKKYDGKDGRPAYVAYKGKIYDVTNSKMWKNGSHMRRHEAGTDLTDQISAAPHPEERITGFSVVGTLDLVPTATTVSPIEARMEKLQKLYHIIHPHPMVVHFPMALVPFAFLMEFLYVFTSNIFFFYAGYLSLAVGFFGMFAAIGSGLFSWWVNYRMGMNINFKMKMISSAILAVLLFIELSMTSKFFFDQMGAAMVYSFNHTPYLIMLFVNFICIAIIGYNGGKLTWPSKK